MIMHKPSNGPKSRLAGSFGDVSYWNSTLIGFALNGFALRPVRPVVTFFFNFPKLRRKIPKSSEGRMSTNNSGRSHPGRKSQGSMTMHKPSKGPYSRLIGVGITDAFSEVACCLRAYTLNEIAARQSPPGIACSLEAAIPISLPM